MPSIHAPRTSTGPRLARWADTLAAWLAPPGLCHICRTWQRDALCAQCLRHWRLTTPRCPRCAIALPAGHAAHTCQTCEDQSPEFDRAIAALDYAGPWPNLVARLKFQQDTALARPLGRLLAEAAAPRLGGMTPLVVPVPLSPERLRERGYNQAWLLARSVAAHLDLPARHDLLTRTQHTTRLMHLSAEARQQAIAQAFAANPGFEAHALGRDIALVDDVLTTGATLNACARTLLQAGARSVSAWVVARTPLSGN
jgi:ComF family protein